MEDVDKDLLQKGSWVKEWSMVNDQFSGKKNIPLLIEFEHWYLNNSPTCRKDVASLALEENLNP